MTLDELLFEFTNLDVIKRKYYDASKVNSLLNDIRRCAEETSRENKRLKEQLDELNGKRTQIADMFLEAQTMSKEIAGKASAKADRLMKEAQKEADGIIDRAQKRAGEIVKKADAEAAQIVDRANAEAKTAMDKLAMLPNQQEYTANCVEECFHKLKNFHLEAVDMLNDQWQSFLCGLYMPEDQKKGAAAFDASAEDEDILSFMAPENGAEPEMGSGFDDLLLPPEEYELEDEAEPEDIPEDEEDSGDALSGEALDLAELESRLSAIVAEMNAMSNDQ